jgi:hypothetical protein
MRGEHLGSIRDFHAPALYVVTWSIKSSVTMRKQYRIEPQISIGLRRGGGEIFEELRWSIRSTSFDVI